MLTIEKQPSMLPKTGVLAAAFMIGLVGSAGALYTIDPKSNATVVHTTETDTKEDRQKTSSKPDTSSTTNSEEPITPKTPALVQPTYQAATPPSQQAQSESEATPDSDSKAEPEAPSEDTTPEDASNDSDVLDLPILRPLLP